MMVINRTINSLLLSFTVTVTRPSIAQVSVTLLLGVLVACFVYNDFFQYWLWPRCVTSPRQTKLCFAVKYGGRVELHPQ